jgi:p-aminobenzoyl-glutamate transporter AbgT
LTRLAIKRLAVFLEREARIFPTPVILFAMVIIICVIIKISVDGESIADK